MFSSSSKKAKLDPADDMVTSFSNIDSQVTTHRSFCSPCCAMAWMIQFCADWNLLSSCCTVWVVKVVVGDVWHGRLHAAAAGFHSLQSSCKARLCDPPAKHRWEG
jgi:hypothetical protein